MGKVLKSISLQEVKYVINIIVPDHALVVLSSFITPKATHNTIHAGSTHFNRHNTCKILNQAQKNSSCGLNVGCQRYE